MPGVDAGALLLITEVAPYRVDGGLAPAGVHHSLGSAVQAIEELAQLCGLGFRHSRSVQSLSTEDLEKARVLALETIGDTRWSPEQRSVILRRVHSGSLDVLGLHCASDASHDWPEYGELLGARFDGHPVTADLPITVVDAAHPAARHLPPLWHMRDEMYLFRDVSPDNQVILALKSGTNTPSGTRTDDGAAGMEVPVAWHRSYGSGQVFYTALGHFGAAWEDRNYLLHVLGALESLLQ